MDVITEHQWKPFEQFGLVHPFFTLNSDTIVHTALGLTILTVLLIIAYRSLQRPGSLAQHAVIYLAENIVELCEQSLGTYVTLKHICFIGAVFIFILTCNLLSLISILEEPTKDLNTTLALGIISFLYIQITAIRTHGLLAYLQEFIDPFFLMAPVHIIGKLATIISMSFRLYGNIVGGATIMSLFQSAASYYWFIGIPLIPMGIGLMFFFIVFEGFLQAFIFTVLSLTYLGISLQAESSQPHHEESIS